MRRRLVMVMFVVLASHTTAEAQAPQSDQHEPIASRFVDRVNGLTLEQAIERALDKSLDCVRLGRKSMSLAA